MGKELHYIELASGKEITEIDTKYIIEGMYIDTELYLKLSNTYILFAKHIFVDHEIKKWIEEKVLQSHNPLYVVDTGYDSLMNQYKTFIHLDMTMNPGAEDSDEVAEKKTSIRSFENVDNNLKEILEAPDSDDGSALNEKIQTLSRKLSEKISDADVSVLLQCVSDIRRNNSELYIHSRNVAMLNGIIGKWMGLDNNSINKLIYVGLVHDIGKLRVPQEVLLKPDRLNEEEYEIVKKHAEYSYDMLLEMGVSDKEILKGVRGHHERANGKGYPDHLTREDIHLYARITAVSDVYDAMISARVYKSAHTPFQIMASFANNRFNNLDPEVISVFLKGMPGQFINKKVLLSNGDYAVIANVTSADYEFPIIQYQNKLMKTNRFLYCVAVDIADVLSSSVL